MTPLRNGTLIGLPLTQSGTGFLRRMLYDALAQQLEPRGCDLVEELRFDRRRKWRFDLAILPVKVAVEYQGGIWVRGKHVRGAGYLADLEKCLHAVAAGWTVVGVSYEQLRDRFDATLDLLVKAVEVKTGSKTNPATDRPGEGP